ncbi:protein mobD, partial [Acidithiobacillus sp. MC6.1]|nr:protein mobD [Acidithiobacillus sp. MC6.1]
MNNVFYVGGSKGGVGKSVVSIAVADLLISRGLNPVIVET